MAATTTKKINFVVNDDNTLSKSLQQLIDQYNSTGTYTRKTANQIQRQAQNEYGSYYDQLRLAAQQANQRSDLALQQQRAGLQDTYDRQRQESEKQYRQAYSQADRQMLSRGMQRSSYTAQVLANLTQQGAEAQQTLWDAQAAAEGNIDAQRTQLAEQLAAQLQQYDVSQQQDILKRISELEDQEYQRGNADMQYRDSLATQIYSFLQQKEAADLQQQQYKEQLAYQKERDRIADQQWQMQFDESKRQFDVQQAAKNKSSGGSGGGSYKKPTKPTTPAADPNQQATDAYTQWLQDMGGNTGDNTTTPPTTPTEPEWKRHIDGEVSEPDTPIDIDPVQAQADGYKVDENGKVVPANPPTSTPTNTTKGGDKNTQTNGATTTGATKGLADLINGILNQKGQNGYFKTPIDMDKTNKKLPKNGANYTV